ncbi:MAG: hypothetical protein V7754_21205, partial [Halioglobus sp.]
MKTKRMFPVCELPVGRASSLALMASLALAPAGAWANEYSFEYGVEAGYEYNDNVRMAPVDELSISGGRVSIPATLASRSERMEASLDGELIFSRFDEDSYDSDDQDLEGKFKYLFERGELEANAGYRRDSTRTSEFLDTGVVGAAATRR